MTRHRFRTLTDGRSSAARGYNHAHRQERARQLNAASPLDPCVRCGQPLGPLGPHTHLDHCDCRGHGCALCGGTGYRGLAHARCNITAGAALGRARQQARRAQTTLRW